MKITIEIDEKHADLIADWASLRRTLALASVTTFDGDCAQELEAIIPALEQLQLAVRSAVWEAVPDRTEARKRNRL